MVFRWCDYVTCRKIFYNRMGVNISVLEHCREVKFRTYLNLTLISKRYLFWSWLTDLKS